MQDYLIVLVVAVGTKNVVGLRNHRTNEKKVWTYKSSPQSGGEFM